MRRCASKNAGPEGGGLGGPTTSIGEWNECQRGHWAPKGLNCEIHIGWGGERNIFYIRV